MTKDLFNATMAEVRKEAAKMGIEYNIRDNKKSIIEKINNASAPDSSPEVVSNELITKIASNDELTKDDRTKILEREIRAKLEAEEIEKRLRKEAEIAAKKAAQMNKYILNYDIADLKREADAIAQSRGGKFQIDQKFDGSLAGTYHVYRAGHVDCGNLAQPYNRILTSIGNFFNVKNIREVTKVAPNDMQVVSPITGQKIDTLMFT